MPNLLKIGYTTRTLRERVQELSTTGVPGKFEIEFFCEIDDAARVEGIVHSRLKKHRYEKEFFSCDVETAVRTTKEAVIEYGYSVFSDGGRSKLIFLTDAEVILARQARQEREQKEAEQRRRAEERKRLELEASIQAQRRRERISQLERQFMQLAPVVDGILRTKSSLGNAGPIKFFASTALRLTVVGSLISDMIDPPAFDDGVKTAKKLTRTEVDVVTQLYEAIKELQGLDALSSVTEPYFRRGTPKDRYLIDSNYCPSGLSFGLFRGLGLTLPS